MASIVAGTTVVSVLAPGPLRLEAATLTVTTTADGVDASPGDGVCATAGGACSLRAAIQEANATLVRDTIELPAGTYALSLVGAAEDLGATGDLDVAAPLMIAGDGDLDDDGDPDTVIDGLASDRVLHILETAGDVTLVGLTVSNGLSEEEGAGIYTASPGSLRLDASHVLGNTSAGDGGGIHLAMGVLRLNAGAVVADNAGRNGGGVYSAGEPSPTGLPSRVEVSGATVRDNHAVEGGGGGVWVDGDSSLNVTSSTFTGNLASGNGGALVASSATAATITASTFEGNGAEGDGGAVYTASERPVTVTHTEFVGNDAGLPVEGEADGAGGGMVAGGSGAVTIRHTTFESNTAGSDGGGLAIENNGFVNVSDSTVHDNDAAGGGGGIENEGMTVNLTRVTITGNTAHLDGGGLESQGSGSLNVVDSTFSGNTAENGGGYSNNSDGATRFERVTVWDNRALIGENDDTGLGGGIYSLGDASAEYENVTISANFAHVRGGGFYVDADAPVHLSNVTISANSAPLGSGISGEPTIVSLPVQPSTGVLITNSIVAGNLLGPNCNFPIGSLGGNIQGDGSCYFMGPRDRTLAEPGLDAIADNGGLTMTMAIQEDSLAIDGGVAPCAPTDQRGVTRPQNVGCDIGAFEYEGPFPPADTTPPDTFFDGGPVQNTENTSIFSFSGNDGPSGTPPELLLFECRLIENELEVPEIPDPTEPPAPELAFVGCQNPWQVPIIEEGIFRFEARAIDRWGNVDPTPVSVLISIEIDLIPPDTFFLETPTSPGGTTTRNSATFTIGATDNATPQQFMEIECRLDSNDPLDWVECTNPYVVTNLTPGEHTVQARAADGSDNVDPTPATFTWTVVPGTTCESGNVTLLALGDTHIDEFLAEDNFQLSTALLVQSAAPGADMRTLIEFALPSGIPAGCELERATLRLAGEGDAGRVLQAIPTVEPWSEDQATWLNQPATGGTPATTTSGTGYRSWNVTEHVGAALVVGNATPGWLVRDATEEDLDGATQSFFSSELIQEPPMPPQLVLRFEETAGHTAPPAPPEPTGGPTTVTCGQVITTSIVVANDLTTCLGEGLVIGAPNIVLDLGGHLVRSAAVLEPGEEDGLLAGIRNSGHENVVIRNGRVENFGYGIRLMAGATYNLVTDMELVGNVNAGVELFDADDGRHGNTIVDNDLSLNGDGVSIVSGSEGSVVEGNRFQGNLGRAVYMFESTGHTIRDNVISGETGNPLLDSDGGFYLESSSSNTITGNFLADTGDAGFVITAGSHDNLIEGNTSSRSSDAALSVAGSDGNQVIGNVFHLTGGAAIALGDANDGVVRGNDVRFNPGGIELSGSNGNLVELNDASHTLADGIVVEGGVLNTIRDNVASHTRATGIGIDGDALDLAGNPANGNVVENNDTNFNLGDGISIAGAGHTIVGNAAHGNASWGITAGTPNVNSGNEASGNGEPPQCQGVVCALGTAPPGLPPDLTAPDTTILTHPVNGASTMSPHTFTFTGLDNFAPVTALHYECRLDAPPDPPPPVPEPGEPPEPPQVDNWHECGSPTTYSLLTAGEHTFEVRAIDPFDNVDLTPAVYTWTVVAAPPGPDTRPPSTTIWSAPDDPSTSTSASIAFRGSDNATPGPYLLFECSLDAADPEDPGSWTSCTSPFETTGLSLGAHTFRVRAIDLAGNVDPTPAVYAWTVVAPPPDIDPPETTIDSTPDATTVATDAVFTFSSDEDGGTFECTLDGSFVPNELVPGCTSPLSLTAVSIGTHTVVVTAIDAAGNRDPSPASFTWTITTQPVPTSLACGAVVTSSVLLLNDLVDCPGDGLVVGAGSITIDLDGHTIDGTGLGYGVRNDGFDHVTITNGTVNEFDAGVILNPGSSANIVSDLYLTMHELGGVELWNADQDGVGSTVRRVTVAGSGGGITLLSGTEDARIHDNLVAGSSGEGMRLQGAHRNEITRNEVAGSSDAALVLEGATENVVTENAVYGAADIAILLVLGSNGNRIEGNLVAESESGIIVELSSGNELIGNVASGAGDSGIVLEEAHDNVIVGNDVRFNSGGIEVAASSRNRIEENDASFSDGTGIEVGDESYDNVLARNIATGGASGISVGATAPPGSGNVIDGNVANSNDGDGIQVTGLGNVIIGNSASSNGGWGIWAALPTLTGMNFDGGGNRAIGNVELLQCHGVRCDGGAPLVVDTLAPETSITAAPVSGTLLRTATFHFTGNDNATAVGFECKLHGVDTDFVDCVSPHTYTNVPVGPNVFEVRAIDFFGNVDATPATHAWTIQAPPPGVPPETTIDSGPDATTVSTTATFTFSSNEPDVTFQCSLDGAPFTACFSGVQLLGLSRTAHVFEVRAVDQDLPPNTDPTPARFEWTITAAPVAVTVSCGQTLVQSTLVQNDLLDCLGNGLQVGAANITIDLGGHTIDGSGLGAGMLNPGFASVTVANGVLQEFDAGVQLSGASTSNIVSSVVAQFNQVAGVDVQAGADDAIVRLSTVTQNVAGIVLTEVTGVRVHDNTLAANSGDAVHLLGADGNLVERNTSTTSSGAAVALIDANDNVIVDNVSTGDNAGILLGETLLPANDNVVERNRITNASASGIEVVESSGNRIVGNTVNEGGSTGIALEGATGTTVASNDVRFNAGAISLDASSGNVIDRNDASSSSGTGISLETLSIGNMITGNRASTNSGDGIYVGDTAEAGTGNTIAGNTASNNSGSGIFVNGAVHTIADNTTELNDGWGIFAVPGNIDGGGNTAAGNAEPAQCSGVVCTIGTAPGAPDTELVLTPTNPSNSSRAIFTFTGTDDTTATVDLGFQCRLDSDQELDFVDCDNPWEITDLTPGSHRFEVRAVDQSEVVDPTPAVFEWTYVALPTGVAPDTFIDIAPPLLSPLLEGVFTFSSSEPDVTFECRLDGGAWEPCDFFYEFAFEEFDVGEHTFEVRATDLEGNTDPTPAVHTWTVTGLVTTVTNGPAYVPPEAPGEPAQGGETEDRTATFEFEANVADATFMCSIDLSQFVPCSSGITYLGLQVGEHLFRVFAEDPQGEMVQLEPTEYEWTILATLDVTPPVANITSAGMDANDSATFVFGGTDNVTSPTGLIFECTLQLAGDLPVELGECASPLTLPNFEAPEPLAIGTYTLTVVAIDSADNVSAPATAVFSYTGDTTAPAAPLIAATPAQTGVPSLTVSFTPVGDLFVRFECSVVPVTEPVTPHAFELCTSPADLQVELPGDYELAVRAVDLAGNVGPAATRAWTVVPPPTVTLGLPLPDPVTTATSATFSFTVVEPVGVPFTFTCTLEGPLGTTTAPCESPAVYSDLGGGVYTFEVVATNAALGLQSDPAAHTWTVDAPPPVPPVTTIVGAVPANPSLETSATFSFEADLPAATFFCSLEPPEPATFVPCTSPVTYTDLVAGTFPGIEYTFAVYAVVDGLAGEPTTFEWSVTLPPPDTTPPNSSFTGGTPPATTTATTASFSFTSTESGSFECALDGAPFSVCSSPVTLTGLFAGTHVFAVRAIDESGNVDPTPATHSWTVQAPPPDCSTVLTLTANADAWLEQGSPSSNKGSDSTLKVMSKSGNANLRAVVRFGLPAAPPAGCMVNTATLRMFASSNRNGRTLRAERLAATWSEGSVNWSNQPAGSGQFATTSSGTGYRQWNVTAQVDTMFASGINHGFLIRDNTENQDHEQQFNSREHSQNRPQLVITFVAAPAPDTTPPETAITSAPTTSDSTSASFGFTGSDLVTPTASLSYQCKLDAEAWAACSPPVTLAGLSRTGHTFEVRAVDAAGNIDPTPASHSWAVTEDTTAPTASITAAPPATTSSTSASFAFTSNESGSTFRCRVNGAAYATCPASHVVTGLAVGTYTLDVYAVDLAGNGVPGSAVSHTWQVVPFVDCGAPVTVTAAADAWVNSASTSQNAGSDSVLKVMSKSGGNNRALVRFNLPTVPAGCVLQAATLELNAKSARTGRTLQAIALASSWTEGGVTWANQPATTGAAATTTSGTGWRQWTVTGQVQSMYSSGGHHGFLVRDASENNDHEQQFDSREAGSNAPRLVLTFAAP